MQTALGGYQSIYELTRPGGRLFQSRQAILDGVAASKYLQVHAPRGAIYAFVGVKDGVLPDFDDQQFAMDLLEHKHVLLAPGTSFNTSYKTHFRITNLPRPEVLADVFRRMEELLDSYAAGAEPVSRPAPELKVSQSRSTRLHLYALLEQDVAVLTASRRLAHAMRLGYAQHAQAARAERLAHTARRCRGARGCASSTSTRAPRGSPPTARSRVLTHDAGANPLG